MRINKWLKTMMIALGLSLAALPAYADVINSSDLPGGLNSNNLNGTINLNGAGNIINWDKFNVGSGSTLEFVNSASKWAVLNRVASNGGISQLDGTINASSGGTVFLVNPSGIVFDNDFTTNANTFVASTLKLEDDAFNNYVSGAGTLAFADDNSGSITVKRMSAPNSFVTLVGNSITVAPGVTMEAKDLALVAGNNVTFITPHENDEGFTELAQYNSSMGNTVTIGDETGGAVTINTEYDFNATGSQVDIKNVKIENAQEIYVAAANTIEDIDNMDATADNVINIKSLETNAEAFYIEGGKISVDGLTYNILPAGSREITIEAANKFERHDEQSGSDDKMFATKENNVKLSNVTISNSDDAPGLIVVAGGSVDIDRLNANAEKGEIHILAGKEYSESEVMNADTSNTISIKNSVLQTDTGGNIMGGNISLENTTIDTDKWRIDVINLNESNSNKNVLVDEAVDLVANSNLTPEEKAALTKTLKEETPVKITESSQQAANDTKQSDISSISSSQKMEAVEPTSMTEESAPAVSVEE